MTFWLHRHEHEEAARHAQLRPTGSGLAALFALVAAAIALMMALPALDELRAVIQAPALNAERAGHGAAPERVHADRR
ncbi:MAG: hypothetical protein JWN93_1847 [Hyphomicrobiales bacterium]|nr:hypothetical protein [Hyphomicrobiales bacterium]